MKPLVTALVGLSLLACKPSTTKQDPKTTTTETSKPTAVTQTSTKTAETKPASSPSMVTVVEKAKEVARYDTPTERRLYPSRADANEFYSQDLHPFFAIDADEKTSWGTNPSWRAYGDDPKEEDESEKATLKLTFSAVEGATQVRLRLKARKSSAGMPKAITLMALPGRQVMKAELKPTEDWQELTFDLTTAKIAEEEKPTPASAPTSAASTSTKSELVVRSLEMKIDSLHTIESDGEYKDYLEISEVEIFVTGLTKENPAFEKEKLENILTWRKAREATVKIKGVPLPVAKEYKAYVMDDKPKGLVDLSYREDEFYEAEYDFEPNELIYESAFKALQRYVPAQAKDAIARAELALESEREKWTPLNVASTALRPYVVPPETMGALTPPIDIGSYEYGRSEFYLPSFEYGTLTLQDQLEIKDSKAFKRPEDCYDTEQIFFWRRPEMTSENAKELIVETCLEFESRGGEEKYRVIQFLEYDDKGRLILWVTPYTIQWFDWKELDGKSSLFSVIRLTSDSIVRFMDSSSDEPAFADEKPWIALSSSKPLFDTEAEKASAELKDKLIAAGFTEAEIFDSRRAKNLSCCFTVVAAGRYKTKKEAQTAAKDATKKGFESYAKKGW